MNEENNTAVFPVCCFWKLCTWDFGILDIANDSLSQCYNENAVVSFKPQGTCSSKCVNNLHFTVLLLATVSNRKKNKHYKNNPLNLLKLLNEYVQAVKTKRGDNPDWTEIGNRTAQGCDVWLLLHLAQSTGLHITVHAADGKGDCSRHISQFQF